MLTSTPIKDTQALKLGLVEEIVPADKLLAAAKARALDIAEGRKPRLMSLTRTDRIEALSEALPILEFARAQVGERPWDACACLWCVLPEMTLQAAGCSCASMPPASTLQGVMLMPMLMMLMILVLVLMIALAAPAAGSQARAPPAAPAALPGRHPDWRGAWRR